MGNNDEGYVKGTSYGSETILNRQVNFLYTEVFLERS